MITSLLKKFRTFILGAPRDPLSPDIQRHIALVAFLAWIGLGADGLSSSCYGPEEAFLALGSHTSLALYIAIATAATVFLISMAYNQVITLFPSGGGGYKVSTYLLGEQTGLVAGAALIVDYILTITISVAGGMDALFSLLPAADAPYKLFAESCAIFLLIGLNLRGMKESIKILLPIFVGFIVLHIALIVYGIVAHEYNLPIVIHNTIQETRSLSSQMGWLFVVALLLRSYSLGSGTYTGLEAVSNNVNRLAEPRVTTGKWTMFYMALSLSFTAAGIILLYLLWNVAPVPGKTLNAVVFSSILGPSPSGQLILFLTLIFEAGLLFVSANTGFIAGPSILANMAIDGWAPNRFRHLSSRLVTHNGVILYGIASLGILWLSEGSVAWLVVLYSINVFLTFSLSILGICVYWAKHRGAASHSWLWRLIFSLFAFYVTGSILIITLFLKFADGGWVTVFVTSAVILLCFSIKTHYKKIAKQLDIVDQGLRGQPFKQTHNVPRLNPHEPTAVILIAKHPGVAMHTLLWVLRMFPGHFKNIVFLSSGIVDAESFAGRDTLDVMRHDVDKNLHYFVNYCHHLGIAAKSHAAFGTDPIADLTTLAEATIKEFPNVIFFATKLTFERDTWIMRFLHNETAFAMQRRLHAKNMQLVILPMQVNT